ncbi:MAG: peptide chain release factor N(5)-glutamine methyltransferase [Sphingomonadales bacterium]|nr:peptide chain release factor N(5)-glutamine methyltransferase [Sphingomonadales bacterium]
MSESVAAALRAAGAALAGVSETPRIEAEWLMASALGCTREELLLHRLGSAVPARFAALLARRLDEEALAYILGEQPFFGLDFKVTRDVLIPRIDSEVLVAAALAARPGATRVLDCGTGSGALLLAVLAHLPQATGIGVDRSAGALAVARENAARLGLAGRAAMIAADWRTPCWHTPFGRFDLVLANPPYVAQGDTLARGVRDYEPHAALFAGPEGLDDYRLLVPALPALLAEDGLALVEIGAGQAAAVSAIAAGAGLASTLHRDSAGRPRVLEMGRAANFVG